MQTIAGIPQLRPWGLSNIFTNHYHCELNPIHLAMGALVCKSSSGPNWGGLGRQLSWCVVWGLLELVGWPIFLCHCGWRYAYKPRWHVTGCWFDRRAGQQNAPVDPCSLVIYSWNGRRGSQCAESCRDLITSVLCFSRCFLPPPIEAQHGVTPSGGVEECPHLFGPIATAI